MSKSQSITKAIRRTPYQSLSAIILTTLTFLSLTIFSLVILGSYQMLNYFESRPQVTAFFKDTATDEDVAHLKAKLLAESQIESSTFVSKQEALALYQEQNQDNPLLLEMVTADILPASLEVSARSVANLEQIASIMQQDNSVEEVVFQKDVIDILRKWLGGIRTGGLFLTILLTFASISTIVVIIGLKFRSKKAEMYTLTLLGASPWYIRKPFIQESMFYGVIGAILGWGITYVLLLYLTPSLINFFGEVQLLPVPLFVMGALLLCAIMVGAFLGIISSLIATRRFGR